jgi:hypothetical protein
VSNAVESAKWIRRARDYDIVSTRKNVRCNVTQLPGDMPDIPGGQDGQKLKDADKDEEISETVPSVFEMNVVLFAYKLVTVHNVHTAGRKHCEGGTASALAIEMRRDDCTEGVRNRVNPAEPACARCHL